MTEPQGAKVAAVTGGSRGIGRAVVERLLEEGWRVAFSSLSPESVEAALAELEPRYGDRVGGESVDVRDQAAVDRWISGIEEREGRIDCLVNNAGLGKFGPVDQISGDDWRTVMRTNLDGAFYATRAVAPGMKERGDGWIFNIASLAGKNPFAGGAAYNASKFGMIGLSEASMLDLRPYGIRVTSIMPGSVDTDFQPGRVRGDGGGPTDWMLTGDDIAKTVSDFLRYPDRALPSRLEIRPAKPPSK